MRGSNQAGWSAFVWAFICHDRTFCLASRAVPHIHTYKSTPFPLFAGGKKSPRPFDFSSLREKWNVLHPVWRIIFGESWFLVNFSSDAKKGSANSGVSLWSESIVVCRATAVFRVQRPSLLEWVRFRLILGQPTTECRPLMSSLFSMFFLILQFRHWSFSRWKPSDYWNSPRMMRVIGEDETMFQFFCLHTNHGKL